MSKEYWLTEIFTDYKQGTVLKVEEEARRAGDLAVLIVSSAKCKKVLGWKPRHSNTEENIQTAWNWHKEHAFRYGG